MSPFDGVGAVCGFLIIILGVFMLHAFNNLDISLKSLQQQFKTFAPVTEESKEDTIAETTKAKTKKEDKITLIDNMETENSGGIPKVFVIYT